MPSMVGTRLISVARWRARRVEVAAGSKPGEDGGRAAAHPVRQHEGAAGVDQRGRVQHHRVGAGGDQVGQDVRADRGVAGLGVHDRLERAGRAGGVEHQHRVAGVGGHSRVGGAGLRHLGEQVERVDVVASRRG